MQNPGLVGADGRPISSRPIRPVQNTQLRDPGGRYSSIDQAYAENRRRDMEAQRKLQEDMRRDGQKRDGIKCIGS